MNRFPALILFNLGDTRSFFSLVLNKRFIDAPGELECPLEVEVADDHLARVSRVHHICILELFRKRYPIDLVPIPLRESKFISGY